MNDYAFGNFVCMLREKKGLTQAEIARQLGVTPAAVSKWENGSSKPRVEILFQLADILGVKTEELMAGHYIVEETLNPDAVRQINERYEYLRKIDSHVSPKVKRRRLGAWLIDWNITGAFVLVLLILYIIVFAPKSGEQPTTLYAIGMLATMLLYPILFMLRDVIARGQSIGKRITKLVVIDKSTGEPAKAGKRLVRNLFLFIVHIDIIVLLVSGRSIGDRVAHTVVVLKTDFENAALSPSISDAQKINSYVAPRPLTKKRIARTLAIIALGIVALITIAYGSVLVILNYQKDSEEYRLAHTYLVNSTVFDALNAKEENVKLISYNAHTNYDADGTSVKTVAFGFSVSGKSLTVVCHCENNIWHVCTDCTAFA